MISARSYDCVGSLTALSFCYSINSQSSIPTSALNLTPTDALKLTPTDALNSTPTDELNSMDFDG